MSALALESLSSFVTLVQPITAYTGFACFRCLKEEKIGDAPLLRCSGCKRVAYCNSECQRVDWKNHKLICKALSKMENDPHARSVAASSYTNITLNAEEVNNKIASRNKKDLYTLLAIMKRPLTRIEQNTVAFEPNCLACGASDRLHRMIQSNPEAVNRPVLRSCSHCQLTFYCSSEHEEAARSQHRQPISTEYPLSPCQIQQRIQQDASFSIMMKAAGTELGVPFQWAPQRILPKWMSVQNSDWGQEYLPEMRQDPEGAILPETEDVFLRAISEGLSYPMTALWALEKFHGEDTTWTQKRNLTIHIIGAAMNEIQFAGMFEEILHRLPAVQVLELVMCSPELGEIMSEGYGEVVDMETCNLCQNEGRKRQHQMYPVMYHELVEPLGQDYKKPDLAIAFNSGAAHVNPFTWIKTIEVLQERDVPTAFIAYNEEEALKDDDFIQKYAPARSRGTGPMKNPWGSLIWRKEPFKVTGFYSINGWVSRMWH